MKIKPFRIPAQVVLPGLMVRVYVKPRKGPELDGNTATWEYDDKGTANIYIASDIPIRRKRWALLHELQHVMVDYPDLALTDHPKHFHV